MIANPNDGNTPQVEQATPQISVSAGGLITATAEQQEGYVPGGTKSSTKQLPTQAAKTVTPGTTNQTAVASGRYTTGAVTVKGDANLKAENIAEGVSIFGVTGTHSGLKEITGSVSGLVAGFATWSYLTKTGYNAADDTGLPGIVAPTILVGNVGQSNTVTINGGAVRLASDTYSIMAFYIYDDFTITFS